ncbi:MAG: UDP-N-acetylmuramoyl-tripeptide--D-alanyl-D-alanine ligase [Bacteroidetes bacterium 4484_249]|nr:MAG: UDP-N-acetylmuramoyl-tripeptide--D-alanyl-D-alanine ligase [Bacteroidetes bacterium 4484_249]
MAGLKLNIETLYKKYLESTEITTDSRDIPVNSIFFALKGDNFNGNDFALDALEMGARYAVIDELKFEPDKRFILVDDVLSTLQKLAGYHRKKLDIKVIGITGTNGKTTTKELIQRVLSQRFKSKATIGNLNNHIGVPLTVLSLTDDLDFAIIEMGANHIGEIASLCEIASPDFGIITNIGKAHLEGFGGIEGVIKAKSELYDFIKQNNNKIFINGDNDILKKKANGIERVTYGSNKKFYCSGKIVDSFPFLKLEIRIDDKSYKIESKLTGRYNFENIVAAVCVGSYFKVPDKDILKAIELYEPSNNRSQIIKTAKNTIISDAYNANPSSMDAAINNFSSSSYNNKVLILGDMFELGSESRKEHQKIIEIIKNSGIDSIFLIGPQFQSVCKENIYKCFGSTSKLMDFLNNEPVVNSTILLKGSRKMQLEKVVGLL